MEIENGDMEGNGPGGEYREDDVNVNDQGPIDMPLNYTYCKHCEWVESPHDCPYE